MMAPASLQVNNMPMMALVNPVYDCLFRLAQPDSLRKEEEVSAGKRAANAPVVLPRTNKKHSPGGMQRVLVQRRESCLPSMCWKETRQAAQKEAGWRCWL